MGRHHEDGMFADRGTPAQQMHPRGKYSYGDVMSEKQSMNFESELDDKDQLLGEEITIKNVGASVQGQLGSTYKVADIVYDGKDMRVSLGSVLSKQWEQWSEKMKDKATPCVAVIVKQKTKRYYTFENIREV